ncbi:MAG: LapA family protein [Methylococcales symbiont of Hymedesmia sp. n. MRB-2018]|nr:MAG: LapA family protein [Methylococcales symbiont of Hymedesmia sp. n. MRB-2018]KAF3983528.1 MAG: LapA family protein [Methylococcales symbiont of Hymedesmia sp. n. MRB-2018]
MIKIIALIFFISVFFIAVIFSVLNFHSVQINLGFTSLNLPLTIALTIELFAGIVIGYLVALLQILKLKSKYTLLNKQLDSSLKSKK